MGRQRHHRHAVDWRFSALSGGSFESPGQLTAGGGFLYFTATDAGGEGLWQTNGASTNLLGNFVAGTVSNITYAGTGNTIFFAGEDSPANGVELWTSNGTASTTQMVADIYPSSGSSNPHSLTEVNGTLFFAATDISGNTELWETGGTAATTQLVPLQPAASACSIPPTWWRLAIAACHLSLVLVLTRAKCTLPTV